jgi:hypothetical protein
MLITCDVEDAVIQLWFFFIGKKWLIKDHMMRNKHSFTGRVKKIVSFMFIPTKTQMIVFGSNLCCLVS